MHRSAGFACNGLDAAQGELQHVNELALATSTTALSTDLVAIYRALGGRVGDLPLPRC